MRQKHPESHTTCWDRIFSARKLMQYLIDGRCRGLICAIFL